MTEISERLRRRMEEDPYPTDGGVESQVKRLVPPGNDLRMSLYEVLPGQTQCPYHFHHGAEELVLVLRGTPTLRTPEGERELEPGDFVHFPGGAAGAHQISNRTDEAARYVVGSSKRAARDLRVPGQRQDRRVLAPRVAARPAARDDSPLRERGRLHGR